MDNFPNWFLQTARHNFTMFGLLNLDTDKPLACLQIGTYVGHASEWMANNFLVHPDSFLDDVDTWEGSDEPAHDAMDFTEVEKAYDARVAQWASKGIIRKHKGFSGDFFRSCDTQYDFIYIDGDHTAQGVLKDAVDADRHLKAGGIMAFDDYTWTMNGSPLLDPKPAIDAFLHIYGDKYDLLAMNTQVWVAKKA
jgi:predicted O-methyltransferase YrrM